MGSNPTNLNSFKVIKIVGKDIKLIQSLYWKTTEQNDVKWRLSCVSQLNLHFILVFFLVYLSQVFIKLVVLAGRNLSLKREIGFAICMFCNAKEALKEIKAL